MVTTPQDDAATLAMLKDMCPYHGRIWRTWDDLGRKGNRNGVGAARLLDAPDGAGTMSATPGEWIAKPRAIGGYTIYAQDDVLEDIIVGFANLNDQTLEEARDNARLFAAAKRMYAVIQGLHQYASPEAMGVILGVPLAAEIASIVREIEGTP